MNAQSLAKILTGLGALLAIAAAAAAPAEAHAQLDDLPPLIDRQLFFDDPEISGAQISPDGRYLSFMRPYQGVRNIWIKGIDEPFDAARPLSDDERPVPGYFWSRNGDYLLYVQDKGGDENYHVWAVDPEAGEGGDVPPARNLTDIDGVRAMIYSLPKTMPDHILVGLNDRDPALHDVYRINLASGERERLIVNDQNVAGWVINLDGDVALAVRQTDDGGTETLRVTDGEIGDSIYRCSWLETCSPIRFHADNERVWFQSNKGDETDLVGLYLMDVASGEVELVERDPESEVDFGGALFSRASDELLATVYLGDRPRIYPQTDRVATALDFLREQLPQGEIGFAPQTADDSLVLVNLSRDVDPGTTYLFNWDEMTVSKLYRSRPELPVEHLVEMQPIRYPARDGLEIPAYLSLPKGHENEKPPLIALIHGGPWARDGWGYRSQVQFLANRGYAVLQPNFRGSTGYGKAFLNAGNLEWGDAMQDDITDGVQHLIDQDLVDPEQVCIMGGSYGGYATLAGLTFTPELYACGVDIVGPSNLITLLESIPAYWGPIRQIFTLRMGDPDTGEGRERLERQSPLNHVEKIQRPLLVIQGANDPRVKQAESDQIVVAMREAGLPVEYIVAEDEGHGFSGRENRLAMFARIEAFLADHLGGRFQSGMDDEIAARLTAMTVDIDSVELSEPNPDLEQAHTAALPAVDGALVADGLSTYTTTLEIQGNEVVMEAERHIHREADESGERLVIDTETRSAMGSASDRVVVDAHSLAPISRHLTQGPVSIELNYQPDRISGTIQAGTEVPINIDLDAPVFGSDAALEAALLGLPLESGYSTTLRFTEIGVQQRVRYFSLRVADQESLDLAGGSRTAWPISLEALDGEGGDMQVWVSVATPRQMLRIEGSLPAQMGGGSYHTELTGTGE